ncbi:hypothetical protein [Pedobacter sp. N23S346]|uniref:hypothetical protein n=1 Tax=Pedobacter sp. N23S346 TaxID=3402750 RepID=UPI003ACE9540
MMKNSQTQVTISELCTQNWEEMEKGAGFNFCTACSKNVIDFSGYSNAEIISVLSGSVSVCGRLSEMQLNQLNYYLLVKPSNRNWMKYLGVLAIGASIFTQDARAAVYSSATEVSNAINNHDDDKKPIVVNKVSGRILGPDKKPQAGIRLVILNTKYYALTDEQGKYEIKFNNGPDVTKNRLSVQSPRYSATLIIDYSKIKQNDIVLQEEPMIMGEIIIQNPKKKS